MYDYQSIRSVLSEIITRGAAGESVIISYITGLVSLFVVLSNLWHLLTALNSEGATWEGSTKVHLPATCRLGHQMMYILQYSQVGGAPSPQCLV